MEKNATTEDMKTLASCINKLVRDGYDEDFKVTTNGLLGVHGNKCYQPDEVHIVISSGLKEPATRLITLFYTQ